MKVKRVAMSVISLVLIFSLAFAYFGGIGVAYVSDLSTPVPNDESNNYNSSLDVENTLDNDDYDSGDGENPYYTGINDPPHDGIEILPNTPDEYDDYYNEYEELDLLNFDLIEQFVVRLYEYILSRNFDIGGLNFWSSELREGRRTGASVANSFFFSPEFTRRNYSNEEFVELLYRALMGRGSDPGGRAFWLGRLNAGLPRVDVFASFVRSWEFGQFCELAGIERGEFNPPPGGMARVFVTRMYRTALQREPDVGGLNHWTNQFVYGNATGASVAYSFIFSSEMYRRNLTDTQFVEILYNALMGRNSDPGGMEFWLNRLQGDFTRHCIFVSFVSSAEFGRICSEHGITRGTPPPSPHAPLPPLPLMGRVVVLDPGHGTVGSPGWGDYNEAVAMLDLALRLRPLLEAQGATVHLTRTGAANIPLPDRAAMINIWALEMVRATRTNPADIAEINRLIGLMQSIIGNPARAGELMNVNPFNENRTIHPEMRRVFEFTNDPVIRNNFIMISLHSNAAASTAVRGAEMHLINPNAHANTRTYFTGYSFVNESRALGDTLLNHIAVAGIPRRTHGLVASNFAIIREVNVPSVLAENGFHTNAQDRALLSNPAWRQTLATHYVNAIVQYFSSR